MGSYKVQPIRDKEKIEAMKRELAKNGTRDLMIFIVGVNTGLRITDLLNLKVEDVKDKDHITISEGKTRKAKRFKINTNLRDKLEKYIEDKHPEEYLFQSRNGENRPIGRVQAYRILNKAAEKVGIDEVGTHTLRKTFGYWFYKKTKDVAMLQEIFNHSSPSITLRYIGINDHEIDKAIDDFTI